MPQKVRWLLAWIESHQELLRHPKTLHLAKLTGWSLAETLGNLHRFWYWCLDYAPTGDLRGVDPIRLEEGVGFPAGALVPYLLESHFICRVPRTHRPFRVHDWIQYAGRYLRDTKFKRQPEVWAQVLALYALKCSGWTAVRKGVTQLTGRLEASTGSKNDLTSLKNDLTSLKNEVTGMKNTSTSTPLHEHSTATCQPTVSRHAYNLQHKQVVVKPLDADMSADCQPTVSRLSAVPNQPNQPNQPTKECAPSADSAGRFEKFWEAYPARAGKKVEKAETFERFQTLSVPDQDLVIVAAGHYAKSERVLAQIGIRDPKRFLRNGRGHEPWRDWVTPEQPMAPSGVRQETVMAKRLRQQQEATIKEKGDDGE